MEKAKKKTAKSCHVVTRRIYTTEFQAQKINKVMNAVNSLYNMGVSHYAPIVETLLANPDFQSLLKQYQQWWIDNPNSDETNPHQAEISSWIKPLQISEFDLQAWFWNIAKKSFQKCINSAIVQKVASNLYSSIRKVIFSSGKHIHYRKYGKTNSLEGKSNQSGIIYNEKTDTVMFAKMKMNLKPVRKFDHYMQEALANGEIKYCRIIRKPFKNGYRYFVQIIMGGPAPKKFVVKPGETGQDPGISNSTFYGDNYCGFETLAKGCEKYEKRVRQASTKYERRRRMANPQNYNPDGTIKKGVKLQWKWTNGMRKALFELKNAYRLKSAHTTNYNGWLSNRIVRVNSVLHQEQMDYRALARRSKKPTERSDKASIVKNKKGVRKTVYKYKRKRRFGRSVLRRAPGMFDKMLRDKVVRYGGEVIALDPRQTASSQVDHISGQKTKIPLSQRTKKVGGEMVQRDFYSSFLNRYTDENNTLNRELCKNKFSTFLEKQKDLIQRIRQEGDTTGNFGLADIA